MYTGKDKKNHTLFSVDFLTFCFIYECSLDYGVDYFKQFTVVMNALDNRGKQTPKD